MTPAQTREWNRVTVANEIHDAVVLGAGISGLVSASILHDQGCQKILVIDQFDKLGGNHIDRELNGYTFDIGSLIFQDDSPLLRHFPELLEHYVPIEPEWGKLTPQGKIAQYPLSIKKDILESGVGGCLRIAFSVLYARLFHREIKNARDFARYWIGDYFLNRSGLESYMKRFFGIPAQAVDLEFAEKRMLWIKDHARLGKLFRYLRPHPQSAPTNRQLARPQAGFDALYSVAASTLRERGTVFELGQRVDRICKINNGFLLKLGDREVIARRIISTIPINLALAACGMEPDPGLSSVSLISLYFSFCGERGFDCSILYNFSNDGSWKRLTVYSDFYGRVNGREYFGVEVIASHAGNSISLAEQNFRDHVSHNKLFAGNLQFEGGQFVHCAYPVYTDNAQEKAEAAGRRLRSFGVESFGRQGGFDYQPTARVSTLTAEANLERTTAPRAS
ncbi:NAD(P)-binding protein [Methylobacterium mesophilicum SR1.6/6]|uniref:NAD(P)-binding protein n=1 Tax=Methylobacterium mesophilicum SR1.6/6 TaxID=908290 RepID=A0A6B9FNN6_9HYPH|nr:NAD(P)-binding protein [Methylobacterium mesophilicum]QGY04190.1 NAD(P)-binding protein [Methylobacterium mesophilicum SR1.6/6]